ncbi:hypothetical protein [Archangium sp.]|uniref:hypothetical protein n=1 Tax=Archangium sp. TaxID=1872627 RepID=UPI00286CF430|nr:hypothetical protein [Archangium sp.]
MTKQRLWLCALAVGALLTQACRDSKPPPSPPPGNMPDSGTPGTTEVEFTSFTRDLILNQTADNNLPTSTEDKNFVDNMSADAFPPAFFQ